MNASKSKSRIEKLLQNLTGTTEHSYHSNLKTPNFYDKSYLENEFDEQPIPVIPQHQNIVDNPESRKISKFGIKESQLNYGIKK